MYLLNARSGTVSAIFTALAGLLWTSASQALPAFARQYEKDCSSCHLAWPQLNKQGREFKENGYRMADEIGKKVEHDSFPIAAQLISRPYTKVSGEDSESRMLHEVELWVAGAIGKEYSAFVEFEYEDGNDQDLGDQIKPGMAGWNVSPALNLQVVWGQSWFSDPYGFLRGLQRLTASHAGFEEDDFGGSDGNFNSSRQSLTASGRLLESKLFYSLGIAGEADDVNGTDAKNILARVAYDFTDKIMVGAFLVEGDASQTNRSYSRYGIDSQIDVGKARIDLAYIAASDDVCTPVDPAVYDCTDLPTSDVDNDAYSAQVMYVFTTDGGRPTFVPTVRYDYYENSQDSSVDSDYDDIVLNLTYYFRENVKAFIEYVNTSAPNSEDDSDEVTLQANLAF